MLPRLFFSSNPIPDAKFPFLCPYASYHLRVERARTNPSLWHDFNKGIYKKTYPANHFEGYVSLF